MHMATKTISITQETYDMLSSWKKDNESFSDVIKRLGRKIDLVQYAGVLSEKKGEELQKAVRRSREASRQRYA